MQKVFFISLFFVVVLVGIIARDYISFFDKRLHMTFCDVGQGDAIFVRTPGGKNILIDGGPDKSILSCLSDHMPFWERKIDMVILTHPHDDHFSGIYYLVDRYITSSFVTEKLSNPTIGFKSMMDAIIRKKVPIRYVVAGDRFIIGDGVAITVIGPSEEYLLRTSPGGSIGESKEFASVITYISYGDFDALLTGDSQQTGLLDAKKYVKKSLEIFQLPHHGSKTGIDEDMIRLLRPKAGIVSVGKNNYGHPNPGLIRLFEREGIIVKRTDKDGNIEIVTDGKTWFFK